MLLIYTQHQHHNDVSVNCSKLLKTLKYEEYFADIHYNTGDDIRHKKAP